MKYPDLRTKPKICLILFITGSLICLALDLIGVYAIADKSILQSPISFPFPSWLSVPFAYIVAGAITGVLSKDNYDAAIYGACIGQCQTLLPLITFYFIFHTGSDFDVWWRALCGIPLTMAFSGIAFSIKKLIAGNIKK